MVEQNRERVARAEPSRGAPDFNQWLTRIHGFKVGTSRNSYTVADLEAAWNASERAWMEVANKNAQERNASVDREVVLLEALRRISEVANDTTIAWESRLYQVKRLSREAIKETESL